MRRVDKPLDMETVCEHRHENCIHYEGCLEEASALLWPSFSCKDCELYIPRKVDSVCYHRHASPLAWEM